MMWRCGGGLRRCSTRSFENETENDSRGAGNSTLRTPNTWPYHTHATQFTTADARKDQSSRW